METLQKKLLILVEGKDEIKFFEALAKYLALSSFEVRECGGKDNFTNTITAVSKATGFDSVEKILLVRDADFGENAQENTFKSLLDSLDKAELPKPEKAFEWTELTKNKPQVAIYVMPYEGAEGMLEHLCLESIPEEEKKCLNTFFECMPEKPKYNRRAKAEVQAFLAAKEEPVVNLGLASSKKYWNFEHSVFDDLKLLLAECA